MDIQKVKMTIAERVSARVAELGRELSPQELIEIINEDPDEPEELIYEIDES